MILLYIIIICVLKPKMRCSLVVFRVPTCSSSDEFEYLCMRLGFYFFVYFNEVEMT